MKILIKGWRQDAQLEAEQILLSVRSLLGDAAFNKALKNSDLITEALRAKDTVRQCRPWSKVSMDPLARPESRPSKEKLYRYQERVSSLVEETVEKVVKRERVNVDLTLSKSEKFSARITRTQGWSGSRVQIGVELTLPMNYLSSPALEVAEKVNYSFLPLECRHAREHDHGDVRYYWVRQVKPTANSQEFKPAETGYVAFNAQGFSGHGTTPQSAFDKMRRQIAKAAKARLTQKFQPVEA